MNNDNTVKSSKRISYFEGNLSFGLLKSHYNLGYDITNLGDLDNDNINDLAVTAPEITGDKIGRIFIFFMKSNGTVKSSTEISSNKNGFTYTFPSNLQFGESIATLNDLDGDNIQDIIVGTTQFKLNNVQVGRLFILFLKTDGTVKSYTTISSPYTSYHLFGNSITTFDDLDNDDIPDFIVAAGANSDNDQGSIFMYFLNRNGSVKSYNEYSVIKIIYQII